MRFNARSMKGATLCNTLKAHNYDVREEVNPNFERATIGKRGIFNFKHTPQQISSVSDVLKYIEDEMNKVDGLSDKARPLQIAEAQAVVKRYLDFDSRTCVKPNSEIVNAFDEEFVIEPDFIYEWQEDDKSYVEVVRLSYGRQKMNNASRGRSLDNSIVRNLEAMAMLLVALKRMKGKNGEVIVTFDSLKAKSDNSDYSNSFYCALPNSNASFCEGCHRVSKTYTVVNGELYYLYEKDKNKVMDEYKKAFDEYLAGKDKCTKEVCKTCPNNLICNYSRPPVKVNEKKVKRDVKNFSMTPAQASIVSMRSGIVRANCGAGTGKTQTVTMRVTEMLKEKGCEPEDFLITTFTNAGIDEIRNRLDEQFEAYGMDYSASQINVNTFNSLGGDIIKKYYSDLGFTKPPVLAKNIHKMDIIKDIMEDGRPEIPDFDYKNPFMNLNSFNKGAVIRVMDEITFIRDKGYSTLDYYLSNTNLTSEQAKLVWEIAEEFSRKMKQNNLIDYSDQSNLVLELLDFNMYAITDYMQYKHIIVDEFQDSNEFQIEFIKELISNDIFESLLLVGDDGQAIYLFRGTSPKYMINIEHYLGVNVDDIFLNECHRCSPEIITLANKILELNENRIKKTLVSTKGHSKRPIFKGFNSHKAELEWIAKDIKANIDAGGKPTDNAFLTKNRGTGNTMVSNLAKKEILAMPYFEEPFLKASRVLACIELAEFVLNPTATKSLMIYLNELFNNSFYNMPTDKVKDIVNKNKDNFDNIYMTLDDREKKDYFMKLVKVLDDGTDDIYKSFVADIEGLVADFSVESILDYIVKFKRYNVTDGARREGNFGAVTVSTIHSSKGREWKRVYISLTELDSFHNYSREEIEEIVRLMYVGFTRAEDELIVTCTDKIQSQTEKSETNNRWFRTMARIGCVDVDMDEFKITPSNAS